MRSLYKGIYVEASLKKCIKKAIQLAKKNNNPMPEVKTMSRKSTIIPAFVGMRFHIYNGKSYIPIIINNQMVGLKLGEMVPTRKFVKHSNDSKKANIKAPKKKK